MIFEKGYLYHVYNQGNNRRDIFFNQHNYLFFLEKMKKHLLPYVDVLGYCLMPNHFHWMILVNEIELPTQGFTCNEALIDDPNETQGFTSSEALSDTVNKQRTLNDSIGILLRSYTRAINLQEGFSGSLFRKETKSICLNKEDGNSVNYFETAFGTKINLNSNQDQYPKICYDYIHQNPVKAGLVKSSEDWPFSSLQEILGHKSIEIINQERLREFELED